ncbi:MAG: dihydropteroate synthase-like protein [Methanobacteriota archaeon]
MSDIIFITGREAAGRLSQIVGEENIFVSDSPVASLINLEALAEELFQKKVSASLFVVPGQIEGDASVITEKTGVPCVKGPKHLANLKLMVGEIGSSSFSPSRPAEDVLRDRIVAENKAILSKGRTPSKPVLSIGSENKVHLNGLCRVIAEIPDAPHLSDEELVSRAKYYLESGASIIDLGMISGKDYSEKIPEMLSILRDNVDAPLSVDSMSEKEILSAVDSGADLILSLDAKTIDISKSLDVPAVIVPRDKSGKIPEIVGKRVALLEELISKADSPCIADPVLTPLGGGFSWSLAAYIKFRGRNPNTPMLFGAGNVTELADADSSGMNMVLAGIASEMNFQLLFTTEASVKTRGCVSEISKACEMMYLARVGGQPPKDLGLDLLKLKEKFLVEQVFDLKKLDVPVVEPSWEAPLSLGGGYFKISVSDGRIFTVYYSGGKPEIVFKGETAKQITTEIVNRRLVDPSHAAYLGSELAKAEIALKLKKNYMQDEDLF